MEYANKRDLLKKGDTMQIIMSREEIAYIVEALTTEVQDVQTDIDNRKARGLDEGYRVEYLKGVKAIRERLLPYIN